MRLWADGFTLTLGGNQNHPELCDYGECTEVATKWDDKQKRCSKHNEKRK